MTLPVPALGLWPEQHILIPIQRQMDMYLVESMRVGQLKWAVI